MSKKYMLELPKTANYNKISDEIMLQEEHLRKGHDYLRKAQHKLNNNFFQKVFLGNYNLKKSIGLFLKAGEEFLFAKNMNMCCSAYVDALEQCYNYNKFSKLDTITIMGIYFYLCNRHNLRIYAYRKIIDYFENYAVKTLEKLNKNVKIGDMYSLLAKNFGNTELAIHYYKKSNEYLSKTKIKYLIDENNNEIKKIKTVLMKNFSFSILNNCK